LPKIHNFKCIMVRDALRRHIREVERGICKSVIKSKRLSTKLPNLSTPLGSTISPHPLDQHSTVHIRVCTVYTEDEFALDPLLNNTSVPGHRIIEL